MTIKELERSLLYSTIDEKWTPPRRGKLSEYFLAQNFCRNNDFHEATTKVKQILDSISHLPDMPISYRPGGIFHRMDKFFYDGYDKRHCLYVFSDLRPYDDVSFSEF